MVTMTNANDAADKQNWSIEHKQVVKGLHQYLITGVGVDEIVSVYDQGMVSCTCPQGDPIDALGRNSRLDDANCIHKEAVKNSRFADDLVSEGDEL